MNRRLDLVLHLIGPRGKKTRRLIEAGQRKGIHAEDISQGIDAGIRAGVITIDPEGRWIRSTTAPEPRSTEQPAP